MDVKALEDIGLTPGEIKVYLALLKIGQSSAGAITKESQVSRSKLYSILDKLARKGLVGHVLKGQISYFKAMEPKRILDYIDEKDRKLNQQREMIKKMLPGLEARQEQGKSKTEAVLYEGIKAIKNYYLNILDDLSSGESYYVLGVNYGENKPGVKEFFENYHRQRAKKNIRVKMLANPDARQKLVDSTLKKAEIRYLPQDLLSNMIVVFYKTKSFIFFLSEEPVGFLMNNEEVTKGFKTYFDTFWKMARR